MLNIDIWMRNGCVWRHMGAYGCVTDAYERTWSHMDATAKQFANLANIYIYIYIYIIYSPHIHVHNICIYIYIFRVYMYIYICIYKYIYIHCCYILLHIFRVSRSTHFPCPHFVHGQCRAQGATGRASALASSISCKAASSLEHNEESQRGRKYSKPYTNWYVQRNVNLFVLQILSRFAIGLDSGIFYSAEHTLTLICRNLFTFFLSGEVCVEY